MSRLRTKRARKLATSSSWVKCRRIPRAAALDFSMVSGSGADLVENRAHSARCCAPVFLPSFLKGEADHATVRLSVGRIESVASVYERRRLIKDIRRVQTELNIVE